MLAVSPLSQRDPKWSTKKLGFSNYTIGSKGCTLTSFAMLVNFIYSANYGVDEVNDKLKEYQAFAKDQYGQRALLIWSLAAKAYPKLRWIVRDYTYSNIKTSWYVYIHKVPVCVEVNAYKIGAPKHWVLYVGDKLMADPWVGKLVPTNTYPATGEAFYQRI